MQEPVYLDYNATTPVDRRVLEEMLPFFTSHYGNASSGDHLFGWAAGEAVDQARESVAESLGALPTEITFTSGATEGINAAIRGVARAYARKGRHIVTVQTEHSAVRETCLDLERQGLSVTYLPVGRSGVVDIDELEAALRRDTILVAVMWANNETGVLQPIKEIAQRVRSRGILFMSDATQAVGKIPVSVADLDLMVCSAHKFYGPKGVGALYARNRVRLLPLIEGGGQERGLRGGTLNVPGIVGMGAALRIAFAERQEDGERLEGLRSRLEATLCERLPGAEINGRAAQRLPQTTSISLRDIKASRLLLALRNVAVSSGSACASHSPKPSRVLRAMGLSARDAERTLRISMGRPTTSGDIDYAIKEFIGAVESLKGAREPAQVTAA